MTDPRPYSKKEIKLLFTNLKRKGITDDMMERLIETLWRNKYTMRTSGFANAGGPDAVIAFNNATRTFSITPLDPGVETYKPRFSFYTWSYSAEYYQRFSTEEIQLPDEEGLYCIYYDTEESDRVHKLFYTKNAGELELKNLYNTKVIIAFIYWDATANEALYFGDDRHGSEWIPQMHYTWHNAFHARRKTGLQLQDFVINGDGSADAHAQFSISSGGMFHDDFEMAIPASGNTIPILYKFGAVPRFHAAAGYAIYKGASRICYNNGVSVVEATEGYYVMYHLFATNEILTTERKTISVMGMAQYEFLADAYSGAGADLDAVYAYIPHQGRCYLGSVIVQTSDAYANAMAARIVGVIGDANSHPPVTIALGSKARLGINDKQELSFLAEDYSWNLHSPEEIIGDLDEPANIVATIDGTGAVDETIPAGTYAVVAVNEAGETLPVNVPEMVILVDTTSVIVDFDEVEGTTGYRVYDVATGDYYELASNSWNYLTQPPATVGTVPVANTAYIYQAAFEIEKNDTVEFTGEGIDVETSVDELDATKKKVKLIKQQSDWNEASAESPNFILNKPTVPAAQIQSDYTQANTEALDFIKNKPTIPAAQIQSDWNQSTAEALDYIKNKPTIPAAAKLPFQMLTAKDIEAGTAQEYTLLLDAREGLTVDSFVFLTDNGTLTGCSVKINGTAITFTGSVTTFDISVTKTKIAAISGNTVAADAIITLTTTTGYTGTPTTIEVQLNYH